MKGSQLFFGGMRVVRGYTFAQGNANDSTHAQAICWVASPRSVRFAGPRNETQKTFSALRRAREALLAAPEVWPGYTISPAPPLSRH